METFSLLQLNRLVRQTIETVFDNDYWVEAELAECRVSGGHCYMELVEKAPGSRTPVAKASAKCWRNTFTILEPAFRRSTGQSLAAGMKVRLMVRPQFHEAYGFSWIVNDIDPTFTLGDMARRRAEIIARLKEEGVYDLQHELSLPLFCQRIAVISAATAAGYGDFCRQLTAGDHGLAFRTELFAAIMQGEQVEQSVTDALGRIFDRADEFDCVVIIRGGGATSDMSGFDTLLLAESVAQFPLPIITGIGHDRDECVLDLVSFQKVKTPTAAAQFLLDHLLEVKQRIDTAEERLFRYITNVVERESLRLEALTSRLRHLFEMETTRQTARLIQLGARAENAAQRIMERERHRLQLLSQRLEALNPTLLLRRGYSITLFEGKPLRSPHEAPKGSEIETVVEKGKIKSITI